MSWRYCRREYVVEPHHDMLQIKFPNIYTATEQIKALFACKYTTNPIFLYDQLWQSGDTRGWKKAIRIISGSKYSAHTGPLFKSLDISTLEDLLNLNALKFYDKYIKDTLPSNFYSF